MKNKSLNPPQWIARLLFPLGMFEDRYSLLDDLEFEFREIAEKKGRSSAIIWYISQIIRAIPGLLLTKIVWSLIMFKYYLKITLRNIKRQKTYTFINIFGLAFGLCCCLFILNYIQFEFSYDKFNENYENIYRVALERKYPGRVRMFGSTAVPLADALKCDFPEVVVSTRVAAYSREYDMTYKETTITEPNIIYADSAFFDVFSIKLLQGDPETALMNPFTVVMTEETAVKYFKDEDPLGKTIRLGNRTPLMVTGITEDIPVNSHFHFNFLTSMSTFGGDYTRTTWEAGWPVFTYVLLRDGTSRVDFDNKLTHLIDKYMGPAIERSMDMSMEEYITAGNGYRYFLQPLTDIHLKSHLEQEHEANGNIKIVYMFAVIALMILFLALINFMNLSTARSANRAKEIGVRKTFGAFRGQLIKQFLFESTFFSFAALIAAVGLTVYFSPYVYSIFGRQINTIFTEIAYMVPILIIFGILTGLLSGSYPAFFLSSFKPISVMKGNLSQGSKGSTLRNILVVFQFTVSIALIIGTLIIKDQIDYMMHRDIGYDREQVLVIGNGNALDSNAIIFKNELLNLSNVVSVSNCGTFPGTAFDGETSGPIGPDGADKSINVSFYGIGADEDYIKTLGIKLIDGRDFLSESGADLKSVILNETAVEAMGFTDPIGKQIMGNSPSDPLNVIGVVKDFHFRSLHDPITPLRFFVDRRTGTEFTAVRIRSENIDETIEHINGVWNEITGSRPFAYSFLDEWIQQLYNNEKRVNTITGIFAAIAIVIGCLGLFGLAAYSLEQRTKEIGIRKVLGASLMSVMTLLSMEYAKLLFISFAVSAPISYLILRSWLNNFAYNAGISVTIFIFAGILAIVVSLVTTGMLTMKAALKNPVDSLRDE
ncbi:ABC transporter permease [candidate division KSB1 bacterium]